MNDEKLHAKNIRLAIVLVGIVIIMFFVTLIWARQYISLLP